MAADINRIAHTPGGPGRQPCLHHRDFPEIRAEGRSDREAADNLVSKLTRTLDSALTGWRRETIERAIADVQAFAAEDHH